MLTRSFRLPGVAEILGPLLRRSARTSILPRRLRTILGGMAATHMLLPTYVRRFTATTAPGVVLTLAAKPRLSMTGLAYYAGLERFEPLTTRLFFHLAATSRVIVDVGANAGVFSLLAARASPAARVIAIEPHPLAAMSLAHSVRANGLDNVEVLPIALGSSSGFVPLYTNVSDTLTSVDARRLANPVTFSVPMASLDGLAETLKFEALDLLKVDVEGAELAVFQGAADTLTRLRPVIVFEVLRDAPVGQLEELLRGARYDFFTPEARGLRPLARLVTEDALTERNAVAVPSEKVSERLGAMNAA